VVDSPVEDNFGGDIVVDILHIDLEVRSLAVVAGVLADCSDFVPVVDYLDESLDLVSAGS